MVLASITSLLTHSALRQWANLQDETGDSDAVFLKTGSSGGGAIFKILAYNMIVEFVFEG